MHTSLSRARARTPSHRSDRTFAHPARRWGKRPVSLRLALERLESRVLMHASPVLDAEHLAVFGARDATTGVITGGLVPNSSLTYISKASVTPENWSDPNTWTYVGPAPTDGSTPSPIPGAGANVLISLGSVVIVDGQFSAPLHTIRDDGTLRFDPHANTLLSVDTIIVEPSGVYQMGTDPTKPDPLSPTGMGQRIDANVRARVIFADTGPIDLAWDPLQFSRGLVSHGDVSIFGTTVTSFEQLAVDAKVGATTLVLAQTPTGWKAGDRLVLTGDTATNSRGVNRDEQVQIVSVGTTNDGHTLVTITDPKVAAWKGLAYAHPVASGYVADVSRNATFESQNVTTVARRGHTMFMHNDDVHIDAAGFYGLGRTDKRTSIDDPVLTPDPDNPGQMTTDVIDSVTHKRVMVPVLDANGNPVVVNGVTQMQVARTGLNPRGRYAVHFHRTGIDEGDDPATVSDSSVVDTPGWGIVNHSSNLDVDGNVVFNAVGAAYVTEAGDEIGTFNGNIAIRSTGSGENIDSRVSVQDFGHQGNGFWLQGGNVSVTNNIVASQRGAGYIFFPRGLIQNGLGTTQIPVADLENPAWAAPGQTMIDVGSVPLREFSGNLAFGNADGFESWFTLLGVNGAAHPDQRNLIENFTTFNNSSGRGVFTPYTALTTLKNVTSTGNVNYPGGTGFAINDVTRDIIYDHVYAVGWEVGIEVPVNGTTTINGGYFNDVSGLLIRTAQSRTRAVNIYSNTDGSAQFGNLTTKALNGRTQYDIKLSSYFNPADSDITRLFNPDVIRMGTVTLNNQQLYYKQQAADFKPFDSTASGGVPAFVPAALVDQTNQQLFDTYGIAVGGLVAPAGASASNPRIDALVGPLSSPLPDLQLLSKRYVNQDNGPYVLQYKYFDPSNAKANSSGYVTVKEAAASPLVNGWNLVTRTILGRTRTLFVYGDNIPPSFTLSSNTITTINIADLNNGSTISIDGYVNDDSAAPRFIRQDIKLNDAKRVSALQSDALGSFVVVSFTISDMAGNTTLVQVRINVTTGVPLIKDIARKTLPTIQPSVTLEALLTPINL